MTRKLHRSVHRQLNAFEGFLFNFSLLVFCQTIFFPIAWSQAPESIRIDSVTVLSNNHIQIGWTYLIGPTNGYAEVHRRLDNGLYAVIARVPMPQSFYIDNGISGADKAYSYYLVAYDENNNVIGRSDNDAHQTIFLQSSQPDICRAEIDLGWQNYALSTTVGNPIPLPSPFNQVIIYLSVNSEKYQPLGVFESSLKGFPVKVDVSGRYCFYIKTRQSTTGITASSNIRCTDINLPGKPSFFHVRYASVNELNTGTHLLLHADDNAPSGKVRIERLEKPQQKFLILASIPVQNNTVSFNDLNPGVAVEPQIYRLSILDSCQKEVIVIENLHTIFLSAQLQGPEPVLLSWNQYHGWDRGVDRYIIQRKSKPSDQFTDIGFTEANQTSFTDFLNETITTTGSFYYRLKALEAEGNPFGFIDESFSNTQQITFNSDVFIPNAFNPSSPIEQNRVFKPVFMRLQHGIYKMMIFNRWGQQIFLSQDTEISWNGTINGKTADAGVYSWVISYEDSSGNQQVKRGTVLLLR